MISLSHLNEFVHLTHFKMETVASVLLSVREGDFLASLDLKDPGKLDPDPSIFEEAIEVHVGGDGLPVPSPVFRTVDRSPGLYQGLRSCVSVGTLPRDQTSPVPGRLVDSCLFGAGNQAVSPEAGKVFPSLARELLYCGRSPGSALAGGHWPPGFARAVGPSQSPSDAHSEVASQGALVPRVRPSLSSGAFATGSETGPVLVDGEGSSFDWGLIWDTCSGSSPVFGRVLFGVGHSPTRSTRGRTRRSCCTSIFSR